MKTLITAIVLAALSGPAFAWETPPATVNNGGNANAKASAAQHQKQSQGQGQGQWTTTVFSAPGRAPDIALPSFGGGGMDCPTVGFGAAGSGLGGGGGFGPSWISSDCNKRKVALLVLQLYGQDAARKYAEQNIDGVKEAVTPVTPKTKPDWCRTSSGIELKNHEECR